MRKKVSDLIITLVIYAIIFLFAWLNDKIFDIITILFTFFFFRQKWTKQFHSYHCATVTIIVFSIISFLPLNKEYSVLLEILFGYFITHISYIYRSYLDFKKLENQKSHLQFKRGITEDELKILIGNTQLLDYEYKILYLYYVKKEKLFKIAQEVNYSYEYIGELKKKILGSIQ